MATTAKLIPLKRIRDEHPEWPYSPWATGHLIRRGRLGCVRVGKRVFVTDDLLASFVARHQSEAQP